MKLTCLKTSKMFLEYLEKRKLWHYMTTYTSEKETSEIRYLTNSSINFLKLSMKLEMISVYNLVRQRERSSKKEDA